MGEGNSLFDVALQKKMKIAVVLACFLAVAAAAPSDVVVGYDHGDHQHTQKGTPGNAVTGSYSFIAADGVEHIITYIADERGYRVVGDAVAGSQAPVTTRAPPTTTRAPPTTTRAPTTTTRPRTTTRAPATTARAIPVQVVPVRAQAAPIGVVQIAHPISLAHAVQYVQVPQQYSTVQVQPQQTAGFHGLGYHHQVQPYAIGGNY